MTKFIAFLVVSVVVSLTTTLNAAADVNSATKDYLKAFQTEGGLRVLDDTQVEEMAALAKVSDKELSKHYAAASKAVASISVAAASAKCVYKEGFYVYADGKKRDRTGHSNFQLELAELLDRNVKLHERAVKALERRAEKIGVVVKAPELVEPKDIDTADLGYIARFWNFLHTNGASSYLDKKFMSNITVPEKEEDKK